MSNTLSTTKHTMDTFKILPSTVCGVWLTDEDMCKMIVKGGFSYVYKE